MHRSTYSRSQDLLHTRDPGLFRLQHALRTMLSVLLTGFALVTAMHTLRLPISAIAPGVVFSMLAPMFSSDATPSERTLTYAVCAIVGSIAYAVSAAVVRESVAAAQAWQIAVLFAGLLFQVRGSRFVAPGVVSLVGSYVGLFTHPDAAVVDVAIMLTGLACAISTLVLWVIVPLRPAGSVLASVVHATLLQASAIARIAARHATTQPAPSDIARRLARKFDYRLARLHAAALAVDDQSRHLPNGAHATLRRAVFDIEVLAERVAARVLYGHGAHHREDLDALLAALDRLKCASREHASLPTSRLTLFARPALRATDVRPPALAWRVATRGALAAAIAVAIGDLVSTDRSFWAVVAVYIAFFGVASRSHAVYKSAQRVFGTVVGAGICALIGHTLGVHIGVSIATILVCVFFWSYFIQANYALGVLFITMLVGLVYGAIGDPLGPILVLRLKETLAGVAGAVAIAVLFLPARTERHIAQQLRHLLRSLEQTVEHCIDRMTHGTGPCPLESMRRADTQLRVLRSAIEPRQRLVGVIHCERPETSIVGLAASSHWLRAVSRLVESDSARDAFASDHVGLAHTLGLLKTIRKDIDAAKSFTLRSLAGRPNLSDEDIQLLLTSPTQAPHDLRGALEQLRAATRTLRVRLGAAQEHPAPGASSDSAERHTMTANWPDALSAWRRTRTAE